MQQVNFKKCNVKLTMNQPDCESVRGLLMTILNTCTVQYLHPILIQSHIINKYNTFSISGGIQRDKKNFQKEASPVTTDLSHSIVACDISI